MMILCPHFLIDIMKNLVIIGAGGMGRTIFDVARESIGYGIEYTIKGFIDDNLSALDGFEDYPPSWGQYPIICPKWMMSLRSLLVANQEGFVLST